MTTLSEGRHAGEFFLDPAEGMRSVDNLTLKSGTHFKPGDVVGKITASSKYAHYDNTLSDGTQTAAGIVVQDVDATSADMVAAIVVRDCEVNGHCLTIAGSAGDITAAIADLKALGIIVRL